MRLHNFVIYFAAAFFIFYGLAFSFFPSDMGLLVTGVAPQNISAMVDFRATYGGMTIAIGTAFIYLHVIKQSHASLAIISCVLILMAVTRAIGLVLDGQGNSIMYVYLVLEVLGSGVAIAAMQGARRDN